MEIEYWRTEIKDGKSGIVYMYIPEKGAVVRIHKGPEHPKFDFIPESIVGTEKDPYFNQSISPVEKVKVNKDTLNRFLNEVRKYTEEDKSDRDSELENLLWDVRRDMRPIYLETLYIGVLIRYDNFKFNQQIAELKTELNRVPQNSSNAAQAD